MKLFHFPLLLLLALSTSTQAHHSALQVENPWVREAPPTAQVLGAFMTLHNMDNEAITITGAHSAEFSRVEIHRTVIEKGMARMLPQSSLTIESAGTLKLEPGGYHLMLIKPKNSLRAGTTVSIVFTFSDGSTLPVSMPVKTGTGDAMDHSQHHH